MQFKEGDIVQSVSDHREIRVVVRPNKRLNLDTYESIGVAECDVYAGRAINIREMYTWSMPDYWELWTDEDRLKRTIEEVIKLCS